MNFKKSTIFVGYLLILLLLFSCNSNKKRLSVLGKIEKISKFSTTEITINKLLVGKKDLNFFLVKKLSSASFVADTEAIIKLGFDFSKIGADDIEINDNSISLLLPPVEVINFSYPSEKFDFKEEWSKDSFLVEIGPEDIEEFFRLGEIELRESLLSMGVVKECQDKTTIVLTRMLQKMEFNEVYIKYKRTISLFPDFSLNE